MKQRDGILTGLGTHFYVIVVLVCGLLLLGYIFLSLGYVPGLAIGLFPIALAFALLGVREKQNAFYAFFVLNYFIMGISRYSMGSAFPFGVVIDIFLGYLALIVILQRVFFPPSLFEKRSYFNGFVWVSLVWLLYAFFQLFNTRGMVGAWASSFRGVAFYMFAVALFAPMFFNKFKDYLMLMKLWSVLTVLAVLKALMQKFIGFDAAEEFWLYVGGGQITHIIGYGVRYFSFFTDAANFGAAMAMAFTVFSICAIFEEKKIWKIWFVFVALFALYGMVISGTRAALAVPFVGFFMLIILSKRVKLVITFSILTTLLFCFLKFTYIGEGNMMIRRMRSAFDSNDPSMVVRYNNQAKLKVYMADKPFGVGLGLGGVKSKQYTGETYISSIPTDSWFVMLWVETGIVGLILNIAILLYILGYGSFQVLFRIRNAQLRGLNIALIGGCSGMVVASYANEILGQFPNGIIIYTSMAILFLSPRFDKELCDAEETKQLAANNHEK